MRRLLPLLVLGFALAGVGAPHALADHLLPIPPDSTSPIVNGVGGGGGAPYRITGATQAAIAVRGYEPLAAPWSPAGTSSIPSVINKAQRKGRILPALRTLGWISVGVVGLDFGWKIGESIGGSEYVYKRLFGDDDFGTQTLAIPNPGWKFGNVTVTLYGEGSTTLFSDVWQFTSQETGGTAAYCVTTGGTCHAFFTDWTPVASAVAIGTKYRLTDASCSGSGGRECWINIATEDQYEEAMSTENETESEHNARAADQKDTTTYAVPGDLGTNTDKENSGSALVASDGSQTPQQQAAEEAICEDLFPGECVRTDNFTLPAPEPNETYTDYMARLAALGHVGTITTVEESTPVVGYGPEAVTRVRIHTTPARVLDPTNWPSTAPEVAPTMELTLRYNPETATPVPTEGGTTPGTTTVTGAPTTIPGTPAVDFSPITSLNPGCKFPYGFICYAVDFTEQFDVTADAPVFTFQLGWTGMVNGQEEGGEAPYTVDLEVMDDYMALWRGILTVVLWVGAIFLVATRMLGVKFGGDPGEAIDDVL